MTIRHWWATQRTGSLDGVHGVGPAEGIIMDVDGVEVAPGVWQFRAKHVGWVLITEGDAVTLVDTGYPGDHDRVLASLHQLGRSAADVAAVVLTHAHPDHLGSAQFFRSRFSTPVWAHEAEVGNATGTRIEQVSVPTLVSMIWRPEVLLWAYDILRLKAIQVTRPNAVDTFTDGILDVPGRPRPVHTPGHTSGHCVLHLPDRGVVVAGDALMTEHALTRDAGPQLLPDFFHTDPAQARASLSLLSPLAADVVVPAHGPAYRGTPASAVELALAR